MCRKTSKTYTNRVNLEGSTGHPRGGIQEALWSKLKPVVLRRGEFFSGKESTWFSLSAPQLLPKQPQTAGLLGAASEVS